MYNEKIVQILENPKNVGMVKGANAIGKAQSEVCSDILKFYLLFDEQGVVVEAKFKTFGGSCLIAVASVTTELVCGLTVDQVIHFDTNEIINVLGALPNKKGYCLELVTQALLSAVDDYYKRIEKEQKEKSR